MNLSCLFGHSYKENTYNFITARQGNTVWYKATESICKCCDKKFDKANLLEIKNRMWTHELAEFFVKSGETEYKTDLSNAMKEHFDNVLKGYREERERLIEREKVRISRIEAGPYTGIPSRSF